MYGPVSYTHLDVYKRQEEEQKQAFGAFERLSNAAAKEGFGLGPVSYTHLKSGAMGARTLDEGAMDEKSGMNFSEYMALLSGNTCLLYTSKAVSSVLSWRMYIWISSTNSC